jgi:hypothetical protein
MRTIEIQGLKDEILKDFIKNWMPNGSCGYISSLINLNGNKYTYCIFNFTPDFGVENYKAYKIILEDEFSNVQFIDLNSLLPKLTWIMNNYRQPEKLVYSHNIIEPKNILNINSQMN